MNTEIIWNNFLEKIKERISPLSYDTWFKDTKLYKLDKNTAIIIVPMILHKKHLEENYLDEIEEIFNSITGTNFNFQFKLENEITEDTLEEKIIDETESIGVPHQTSSSANLNSDYTFDSFIVGDSNRFAFTAARAVAGKPGKAYNDNLEKTEANLALSLNRRVNPTTAYIRLGEHTYELDLTENNTAGKFQ